MFKPSVGYVLMAGVLSFAFINAASAEPFNADLSRQYMSGDKAAYLAGVHTKKGLDCAACHTTTVSYTHLTLPIIRANANKNQLSDPQSS